MGLNDSSKLVSLDFKVHGRKLYNAALKSAKESTDRFGNKLGKIINIQNTKLVKSTDGAGNSIHKLGLISTHAGGAVTSSIATMKKGIVSVTASTKNMAGSTKQATGMLGDFTRALKRVLIVVPLWAGLRLIMQTVSGTIKEIISTNVEFIKTMGRVATVTLATGSTMEEFNQLTQRAIEASKTSTLKLKDMATAMYTLATSGLNATQTMAGFTSVIDLAEGTMTDVEQTGRLVAGAFNLFGKEMQIAGSIAERFAKIADTLAATFSTQQVELSEIATAFRYAGAASNSINFGFKELVGTIGFLNTGMLKGSKSGTALTNAIIKASKNIRGLERATGKAFDSTKPLEFVELMGALNERYGQGKASIEDNSELIALFGIRGVRAIQQIIQRYDDWGKAINMSGLEVDGQARKLKDVLENNVPRQLELLKKKWLASWAEMGDAMNTHMLPALKNFNEQLDKIEKRKKIKLIISDVLGEEVKTSGITKNISASIINAFSGGKLSGVSNLIGKELETMFESPKGLEEFEKRMNSFTQQELSNFHEALKEINGTTKETEKFTIDLANAYIIEKDNLGKLIEEGKQLPDIGKEIQDRFGRLFDEKSLSFLTKITEEYIKQAKITKDTSDKEKVKVAAFKDITEIRSTLNAYGYTELDTEKKILEFMIKKLKYTKDHQDVKEQLEKLNKLEISHTRELVDEKLQRLQAAGATEIQLAEKKIQLLIHEVGLTKDSSQIKQAALEKELAIIKEQTAYAEKARGIFQEAFKSGLDEGNIKAFRKKLAEGIRSALIDSLATGLTENLLNMTGLGTALSGVFQTAEMKLPIAINTSLTTGGNYVGMQIRTALMSGIGGGVGAGAGALAGAGGGFGAGTKGIEDDVKKGVEEGQQKTIFSMDNFTKALGVGLLAFGLFGGKSKGTISQKYATADAFNGVSGTSDPTTRSSTRAKITSITISNVFQLDGVSLNGRQAVESFAEKMKLIEKQIFDKLSREGISSGEY